MALFIDVGEELNAHLDRQAADLKSAQDEVDKKTADLQRTSEDLEKKGKALAEVQAELVKVKKELHEKGIALENAKNDAEMDMGKELATTKAALVKATADYKKTNTELAAARSSVSALTSQLTLSNGELAQTRREIEELQKSGGTSGMDMGLFVSVTAGVVLCFALVPGAFHRILGWLYGFVGMAGLSDAELGLVPTGPAVALVVEYLLVFVLALLLWLGLRRMRGTT